MSLRQTIRDAGGGLFETSLEEASKLGVTSPMVAANAGAGISPDMAKMAGTPAQKTSAVRSAVQGETDLSTAMRRRQVSIDVAGAEDKKQKAEQLSGLENLGTRVQGLVTDKLGTAFTTTPDSFTSMIVNPETGDTLTPDQIEWLKIIANPNSTPEQEADALFKFNESLGKTTIDQLNSEDILANYQGQLDAAQEAVVKQFDTVEDAIIAGELDFTQMGFNSVQEVNDLLGTDISGMSFDKLIQTIDSEIDKEYSQVTDLQIRANDINLSPAARAEARAQLREMGAVGIRTIESDMDKLAEDIQDATTIKIANKDMTVNEFLEDEFLSGLAKVYLTEDHPERDAILKDDNLSEFRAYIDSHKSAFQEAVDNISDDVSNFVSMNQTRVTEAKTLPGGIKIDDSLVDTLLPGLNKISTDKTYEASDLVKSMKNSSPTNAAAIHNAIKTTFDRNPNLITEIAQAPKSVLDQIGINNPTGETWKRTESILNSSELIKDLDFDNLDHEQLSQFMGFSGVEDFKTQLAKAITNKNSGFYPESSQFDNIIKYLPRNTEGKLVDPENFGDTSWQVIFTKFKDMYTGKDGGDLTFNDIINNNISDHKTDFTNFSNYSNIDNDIYTPVMSAFRHDSVFDQADYDQTLKNIDITNIEELTKLDNLYKDETFLGKAAEGFDIKKTIKNEFNTNYQPQAEEFFKAAGFTDSYATVRPMDKDANTFTDANLYEQTITDAETLINSMNDKLAVSTTDLEKEYWQTQIDSHKKRISDYKQFKIDYDHEQSLLASHGTEIDPELDVNDDGKIDGEDVIVGDPNASEHNMKVQSIRRDEGQISQGTVTGLEHMIDPNSGSFYKQSDIAKTLPTTNTAFESNIEPTSPIYGGGAVDIGLGESIWQPKAPEVKKPTLKETLNAAENQGASITDLANIAAAHAYPFPIFGGF